MQASARFGGASTRSFVALAVIGLHLFVIISLERLRRAAYDIRVPTDDAMTLRLIPARAEQAPAIEAQRAQPSSEPLRLRADSSQPSQADLALVEPAQPKTSIDWRENAVRSAQRAVDEAGQERYRSFGPRKAAPREEAPVPSLFARDGKHKSGDIGESVNGDPVVWINENCFSALDRSVQTAHDWVIAGPSSFAPASINCVGGENGQFRLVMPNPASFTPPSLNYSIAIGRRDANGKLFEHIKKAEEPPVPKTGTEMNELPREIEAGETFER